MITSKTEGSLSRSGAFVGFKQYDDRYFSIVDGTRNGSPRSGEEESKQNLSPPVSSPVVLSLSSGKVLLKWLRVNQKFPLH